MSEHKFDRRLFLGGSAATLGYFFTADAWSAVRAADGPMGKLRVAGIGIGGKGGSDISGASKVMDVTALCDCDRNTLGKQAQNYKGAFTTTDMRKLFDDATVKTFDAITVSTPDHNHAWPSITAMRLGKHVYCQKPLTHDVFEARLMRDTAKKYKVCGQMGNQGSAENGLRRAVELVQEGILGKIKEIHVWTNRPIWPQAPKVMKRPPEKAVPDNVDWEAFIGTAPMRPYGDGYHPFAWRGWLDYGTGALCDMACHTANMAFRACELASPTTIEADATDVNDETFPSSAKIRYEFPKRGSKDHQTALTMFWYEGARGGNKVLPPQELLDKVLGEKEKLSNSGSIIVGEKAILFSPNDYGAAFRILVGKEELAKGDRTPKTLPINGKGDDKPELAYSNFDIAGMLTEAILLGNVAMRAGKKIEFDAAKVAVTNDKAANAFIKREYRKGWELSDKV
jgi:predicted dehydrogenase